MHKDLCCWGCESRVLQEIRCTGKKACRAHLESMRNSRARTMLLMRDRSPTSRFSPRSKCEMGMYCQLAGSVPLTELPLMRNSTSAHTRHRISIAPGQQENSLLLVAALSSAHSHARTGSSLQQQRRLHSCICAVPPCCCSRTQKWPSKDNCRARSSQPESSWCSLRRQTADAKQGALDWPQLLVGGKAGSVPLSRLYSRLTYCAQAASQPHIVRRGHGAVSCPAQHANTSLGPAAQHRLLLQQALARFALQQSPACCLLRVLIRQMQVHAQPSSDSQASPGGGLK